MKISFVLFLALLGVAFASKCTDEKAAAPKGVIGTYIPECHVNGDYKPKQCWSSIGMCWCVDKKTGDKLTEPTRDNVTC